MSYSLTVYVGRFKVECLWYKLLSVATIVSLFFICLKGKHGNQGLESSFIIFTKRSESPYKKFYEAYQPLYIFSFLNNNTYLISFLLELDCVDHLLYKSLSISGSYRNMIISEYMKMIKNF